MKKSRSSEKIHFHKKYEFYLSPSEFLDMVWVYRNEIKPFLKYDIPSTEKERAEASSLFIQARNSILNGDLSSGELEEGEIAFWAEHFSSVFVPFEEAVDQEIRKPAHEKILAARNSFADLLYPLSPNSFSVVSSNLFCGNIVFQISEREKNTTSVSNAGAEKAPK